MTEHKTSTIRATALGVGLLGAAVAVGGAFFYVATNDWFGASDIATFGFWSTPFALVLAVAALVARTPLQLLSRRGRYILAVLLGLAYGLVWTMAVTLGLGAWVGAFSFPIAHLWMLGGLSAMLIWAFLVGGADPSDNLPARSRVFTARRAAVLVIVLPIGAMLLGMGISFGSVIGSVYVWDRAEAELHLIPEGFEGPVIIVFNDSAGAPVRREGKSRLYEIPPSGVLYTQFLPNDGWIRPVYMYVDEHGIRRPIVTGSPCEDLPNDPVQACLMGRRMGLSVDGSHFAPEYSAYVVGRKENRRELYSKGDSLVGALLFEDHD